MDFWYFMAAKTFLFPPTISLYGQTYPLSKKPTLFFFGIFSRESTSMQVKGPSKVSLCKAFIVLLC